MRRNTQSIRLRRSYRELESPFSIDFDAANDASAAEKAAWTDVYILPITQSDHGIGRMQCLLLKAAEADVKQSRFLSFDFRRIPARRYQRIGRIGIMWMGKESISSHAAGDRNYSHIQIDEHGRKTYYVDLI
jgi:hypothetical protein